MGGRLARGNGEKRVTGSETRRGDDTDRFREIYRNVTEFIFEHDLDGHFLWIYPRYVGFLGFSRDELLSLNVRDLLPETYQKQFDSYIARISETGRDEGLIQLQTKAGRKRIVEHKNLLAVGPDGRTTVQGIARDVTDVLETDQALIESEMRFRSILDSIEDGYFEVDLAGNFTFFNDQIPNHLGYEREDLVGVNYTKYMDKDNAKIVFETFHNVFMTGISTKTVDWELIRLDGTTTFVEASVSLQRDRNGNPTGFCGIIRDITDRKRSEKRLAYLAYHDTLTGLYNRKAFLEELEHELAEAKRFETRRSILYIDLDHFKQVNDVYGHEVGDKLLVQVATRLRKIVRKDDYISRLGGDEFTVVLGGFSRSGPEHVAMRIQKGLSKPYFIQGIRIDFVASSIGVSTYPDDGLDAETLLKQADRAMYLAKEEGNRFVCSGAAISRTEPRQLRKVR